MATSVRHIPIQKESELARLVDAASRQGEDVILEIGHRSYRLVAEPHIAEDPWKTYDPGAVKRALAESAGAFAGMDTERLKREIRGQRGQDSPGRPT